MLHLLLLSIIFIVGCRAPIIPVYTDTKQGESVIKTPIQETGNRKDVPSGVNPRHVVAEVTTKSGAKAWVVDEQPMNPFNKPDVYQNKKAEEEGLKPIQPKDPWWKWVLIPVSVILILAVLVIFGYLFGVIKSLAFWRRN